LDNGADIVTTGANSMNRDERTAYWRGLVDEQAQSELSAATFCRDRHLKVEQFYRWRRRFRPQQGNDRPDGFLQLIPSSEQSSSGVRLHLHNGLWIELERDFDPHTLRTAIEVLSER
jgi:hypothetical protein